MSYQSRFILRKRTTLQSLGCPFSSMIIQSDTLISNLFHFLAALTLDVLYVIYTECSPMFPMLTIRLDCGMRGCRGSRRWWDRGFSPTPFSALILETLPLRVYTYLANTFAAPCFSGKALLAVSLSPCFTPESRKEIRKTCLFIQKMARYVSENKMARFALSFPLFVIVGRMPHLNININTIYLSNIFT